MENVAEKKTFSKMTIEMGADEYVFSGGSVEPGVPIPPDTVNTAAIINGAVEMEDLNQEVKDKMLTDDDRVTREDLDNFNV